MAEVLVEVVDVPGEAEHGIAGVLHLLQAFHDLVLRHCAWVARRVVFQPLTMLLVEC